MICVPLVIPEICAPNQAFAIPGAATIKTDPLPMAKAESLASYTASSTTQCRSKPSLRSPSPENGNISAGGRRLLAISPIRSRNRKAGDRLLNWKSPPLAGLSTSIRDATFPRTTHAGPYQPLARAAWPNRNLSELRGKNTLPLTETGLQFFPLRSTYCYG